MFTSWLRQVSMRTPGFFFNSPLFSLRTTADPRGPFLHATDRKHASKYQSLARTSSSIVVLGGTSGVGRQIVKYLESNGAPVTSFSRRTGYNFQKQGDTLKALAGATMVAISVGAGRSGTSSRDELAVYRTIADALSLLPNVELAVVILRSLILPEVQDLFERLVKVPWVLLRPGPLVCKEQTNEALLRCPERVLVTADIRCNGLVSRGAVGRVAGDLLLGKMPVDQVRGQVFGIYDLDRMINHPSGVEVLGQELWQ